MKEQGFCCMCGEEVIDRVSFVACEPCIEERSGMVFFGFISKRKENNERANSNSLE